MQHVRIKSSEGEWVDKNMDGEEIVAWFKDNTKDGQVTNDITLFTEATFDVEKQEDQVDWVLSDMSLDRDQERVDPQGADFKNFKKNPVVLWAHDYTRPAIGKISNPKVKDGKVVGKVEFDSKDNDEFAYMVGQKVKKGFISAGSIGFKPTTVEFVEEPKDNTRLVHRKWELMEFSICNVPANINALAMRAEDKMPEHIGMMNINIDSEIMELFKTLGDKMSALEARVAKAEADRNIYTKLFEDKREPSAETSTVNDKVDVTVYGLSGASETSGQHETDKIKEVMYGL